MGFDIKTLSDGERFALKLMEEYGGSAQDKSEQKKLIQGYYVMIDQALQKAEQTRPGNEPAYSWANVNMKTLGRELICCARAGLDIMQEKQITPVISKSEDKAKYDVVMRVGCNGDRQVAMKYARDIPVNVTLELVYSGDEFEPVKKGQGNTSESYKLEIKAPFNRGGLTGGFGYLEYEDPAKNKLVLLSKKELDKRIAVGLDGPVKDDWYEELCLDTLTREVYSERNIPRDPAKIDDAYWYLKLKAAT